MYSVSRDKYPQNKAWEDKIFSTPSVPGGKDTLIENLRILLSMIQNNAPLDEVPRLVNSESKQSLKHLCVHVLGPMNFVRKCSNGYELTESARIWIDSEDNDYLAAYFCANVRFFAEILYYLDTPKKSNELFDIAVREYDMAWKLTTTINNRLIWLRQFGLIEFQDFSLLYNITEKGKVFLENISPVMPEMIKKNHDITLNETDVYIKEEYIEFYYRNKVGVRKPSVGYFPGKIDNFVDTIAKSLEIVSISRNIDTIYSSLKNEFNIGDSSVKTYLGNLSSLGLIERKSNTEYVVTDLGVVWLNDKCPISINLLIHSRSLFLFEILGELENASLSIKELSVISKVKYGFDKENANEIRNRMALLKTAGLVMNVTADKYTVTNRGMILISQYFAVWGIEFHKDNTNQDEFMFDIISELRMSSKDSFNPEKFEKVVRDYFDLLGFEAEWIGGSGNTDVLVSTKGSPINSYVVTVDAKSTSSPNVTDSLVDFDTLKEHKKKHGSDYIAIVGRSFESDRLVQRAKEHGVVLLDVDSLEELLEIQTKSPLKLSSLSLLFRQSGKVDLSVLDDEINRINRTGILVHSIMSCLIAESDDPVTRGQLSVRDIYRSLRHDDSLVEIKEIESVLGFLCSPIIGCVMKEKDYYIATGSLADASRMFEHLGTICKEK